MKDTTSRQYLDEVQSKLLNNILFWGTILGFLSFIVSFNFNDFSLHSWDTYTDLLTLGVIFFLSLKRQSFSTQLKVIIVASLILLMVQVDLVKYGVHSSDQLLLIIIPFVVALVFNRRITILVSAALFTMYLSTAYAISSGHIIPEPDIEIQYNFVNWVDMALMMSIITLTMTVFVHRLKNIMYLNFVDLEKRNADLAEREYLLTRITNNIPRTQITLYDSNLNLRFHGGKINLYNESVQIGKSFSEITHDILAEPEQLAMIAQYQKTLAGEPQSGQIKIHDQIFEFKTIPLYNQDGEIGSILCVSEDVSEKVKKDQLIQDNLEEKNVLLAEIHHRVKNNLAVVSGLLELQGYHIQDPETKFMLRKNTNRILSIAKVHELLYESQNFSNLPFDAYIDELAQIILASLNSNNHDIRINTSINVKKLSINLGVPLGIIFNELITNSLKYGFKNRSGNSITIHVEADGDLIRVTYQDNGHGIANFESERGKSLGFTLIEQLLAQIDATHTYKTDEGFRVDFSFPK